MRKGRKYTKSYKKLNLTMSSPIPDVVWFWALVAFNKKDSCDKCCKCFFFSVSTFLWFFKKMGQPRPLFRLILIFFSNNHYKFLQQIYVKKCPVYSAGIRTHNLRYVSLLPQPLDQGNIFVITFDFTNTKTNWFTFSVCQWPALLDAT